MFDIACAEDEERGAVGSACAVDPAWRGVEGFDEIFIVKIHASIRGHGARQKRTHLSSLVGIGVCFGGDRECDGDGLEWVVGEAEAAGGAGQVFAAGAGVHAATEGSEEIYHSRPIVDSTILRGISR